MSNASIPGPLREVPNVEQYVYDTVPNVKTGRIANIAVLRQTDSYNIFTTEGTELNLASTAVKPGSTDTIQRIVMFKRKQVASERRTGKEEIRALYKQHRNLVDNPEAFGAFDDDADLCRLHNNLCGNCVDCKLYGFANAEVADGSRHSRVLTDSAFSLRGLEQREDITFNAQSEETESESSTSLNSLAHTQPETYFPSIVSIRDFTWRDLYWLIYLLQNTTRYGAETSRTGYVDNTILSIWFDSAETISNLELTKRTRANLEAETDEVMNFSRPDVRSAMQEALPETKSQHNVNPDDDPIISDVNGRLHAEADRIEFIISLHDDQTGN